MVVEWGEGVAERLEPALKTLQEALEAKATEFAEVVKAAFGQRRKTLRNALNNVVSAEQFVAAGVRPDARAEQLDVAEFIALANAS